MRYSLEDIHLTDTPNDSDAPNAAIAPRFHVGSQWRGVGDPCRSTNTLTHDDYYGRLEMAQENQVVPSILL